MAKPLPEPREGQPIEYGGLPGAWALMALPLGLVILFIAWLIRISG